MTQMATKYNLSDFENIISSGFNFTIPDETMQLISKLSMEVGSPTYIKTPIFQKNTTPPASSLIKKKKNKNNVEINNEDWETIRSFHTTTIEHKKEDEQIDKIRSCLNKLTDKTFLDMKTQIVDILNHLVAENVSSTEMTRVGNIIFEIASNNKFYSKLYADIYTELIKLFPIMNDIFKVSYLTYIELFNNIEYVDSTIDYNLFCLNNKKNENRKAISTFFINLSLNGIIDTQEMMYTLKQLLEMLLANMVLENKKNEVDELTENIAIFYNKKLIELYESTYQTTIDSARELFIDGKSLPDTIRMIASIKVKTYSSLSSKSIFKFMDM
jgi:hypothetical protein